MNKTIKLAAIITSAFLAACLLTGCGSSPKTNDGDELDKAINEVADYLNVNVQGGVKIAVISIKSNHRVLSEYIIDTLTERMVNDRFFTVVERGQLEVVRAELNLNMSGEVDDDSAQRIGKMLGAQTIVLGSVSSIGNDWRMSVRVLNVENAEVQGLFNKTIRNTGTIAAITSGKSSGAKGVVDSILQSVF